jgi:hypothetical protein
MAPATTTLTNGVTSEVVDSASDKGKGLEIFMMSDWSIGPMRRRQGQVVSYQDGL